MAKQQHEYEHKTKHGVFHRPHWRHVKWLVDRYERYEEWKHQQQKDEKKRLKNKDN